MLGKDRLIFSVQERASGDLTIRIKPTVFHDKVLPDGSIQKVKTIEQHYSVHRSTRSDINALKLTSLLEDGDIEETRNYTKAIKQNNKFAGLFIRRTGDMKHDRYSFSPTKGTVVSLGQYHPTYFQPTFFVFVGPRDREFKMPDDSNINIVQQKFEHFNLVVLWQFFALNGEASAASLTLRTFPAEDLAKASHVRTNTRMVDGFDEAAAIEAFHVLKNQMAQSMIDQYVSGLTNDEKEKYSNMIAAFRNCEMFLKIGGAFSVEHQAQLRWLGAFPGVFKRPSDEMISRLGPAKR